LSATRRYVTACRRWQLPVLLESMRRHCGEFRLHVLCWDWDRGSFDPGLDWFATGKSTFLARNPRWANMPGPPRATIDQVATARWRFACDVMTETGESVTLIDGDQWFWSSPEPVFAEIGDAPMAVSPHRFPRAADGLPGVTEETHGKFGRFNTGWTYLRDPRLARELAEFNLAWSYTDFRRWHGREIFGDQGYVEWIQENSYGDAHVIDHPGVNVGPWNVHRHLVIPGEPPTIDGHPLVSYHYSSMRFDSDGDVTQWADPGYAVSEDQIQLLYLPYAQAVKRAIAGGA
jgi:hypothetical protein